VYKVLENGSQLTQKDLIRETALPSRTVRYALKRLKEEQIVVERYYFTDARQSLYGIGTQNQEVIAVQSNYACMAALRHPRRIP
jgi:hypothetical protein